MIKPSTSKDLKQIALCHRSAFPKSFSSKLGQKYCEKMFEWYLSTDKAFLFHLIENNNCIGYCGGIINDGTLSCGSSSAMTQYSFNQAIKSLLVRPWLLFHKEMIKNYAFLLKNISVKLGIKKLKKKKIIQEKLKKDPFVGLVVIGVNSMKHGKGYGRILLEEFEKKVILLKIRKIQLTVKTTNKKAIKSYTRNGWIEFKRTKHAINMKKILKY